MKTKIILILVASALSCLWPGVGLAQRDVLAAVNDTVDITPGIPVTLNILANDTIPEGDSVVIQLWGSSPSLLTGTINTGGNVTFVLKPWGYSGDLYAKYKIKDVTQGLTSDMAWIVFRIHDKSFGYLDINNVRARFNSSGLHFLQEGAGYEVPKGSGKVTLFSNAVWIGGKDANDLLHFAGERYRQSVNASTPWTKPDFWAGPISDPTAYTIYQDTLWNYMWKLNQTEIEYHRNHYWDPGYHPVTNILTWPGNGNTALGQAHQLAPFSDRNGNGLYEPYDGDYPEIRGDQALFFIYNDGHGIHLESEGKKLNVEIHGMAYAFDRPNDTAFKNTVFLHCKIINRSQITYTGTFLGIFADIDLGYANDDYVGCDPERGMFYGYNGYPIDGTGQPWAYGANPPMQAIVILAGPIMDADGFDNPSFKGSTLSGPSFNGSCDMVGLDSSIISMKYGPGNIHEAPFMVRAEAINGLNFGDGIIDNERYGMSRFIFKNNSNPGVPSYGLPYPAYAREYYLTMEGKWSDSTKMVYGGNGNLLYGGYGPGCNFMFPGLSDTCNWGTGGQTPNGMKKWTEETAPNFPQDRNGVASTGPFTFKPGDAQELDLAFAWARNYTSADSALSKLNAVVDTIRSNFRENRVPGGGPFYGTNDRDEGRTLQPRVYPNPSKGMFFVEIPGVNNAEVEIFLISSLGKIVYSKTTALHSAYQVNATTIPSGFYLLKVVSGSTMWMKKVLILK